MSSRMTQQQNGVIDEKTTRMSYKKKAERAKNHGVNYQIELAACILLQATTKQEWDFKLACEWDDAGKVDDLVLVYRTREGKEKARLFQLKHSDDKTKTLPTTSLLAPRGDFSLLTYYKSYVEVINNTSCPLGGEIEIDDIVLFTNRMEATDVTTITSVVHEILLDFTKCSVSRGKQPQWKQFRLESEECTEEYNKFIDALMANGDEAEAENCLKFLRNFKLATSQPNVLELKLIVKEMIKCSRLLFDAESAAMWEKPPSEQFVSKNVHVFYDKLFDELEKWYNRNKGFFLTRPTCKQLLHTLRSDIIRHFAPDISYQTSLEMELLFSDKAIQMFENKIESFLKFDVHSFNVVIVSGSNHLFTVCKMQQLFSKRSINQSHWSFVQGKSFKDYSAAMATSYRQVLPSLPYTLVIVCESDHEEFKKYFKGSLTVFMYSLLDMKCEDKFEVKILFAESSTPSGSPMDLGEAFANKNITLASIKDADSNLDEQLQRQLY